LIPGEENIVQKPALTTLIAFFFVVIIGGSGALVMVGVWLGALSSSRKEQVIQGAPRFPC